MTDFVEVTEQALLGQIIFDNRHYPEAAKSLRVEDFYLDTHRRMWRHIVDMIADGRGADYLTLSAELDKHGELSTCGGSATVAAFTELLVRSPNVAEYVRIVKEGGAAPEGSSGHRPPG